MIVTPLLWYECIIACLEAYIMLLLLKLGYWRMVVQLRTDTRWYISPRYFNILMELVQSVDNIEIKYNLNCLILWQVSSGTSVACWQYRGHPCLGLAAIFAGMLYNVQIIQKSSTRNTMHVSIIVLELPAKLQWVID